MDLAVLAALTARAPLAVRAADPSAATFDLAQTCAALGLECAAVDAADLPARRRQILSTTEADGEDGVDVLIVRDLDRAGRTVQAEAVDLVRARDAAAGVFLFVALSRERDTEDDGDESTGLFPLLHTHAPSPPSPPPATWPTSKPALQSLQEAAAAVHIAPDVARYAHDIATHLRLHRAVGGGVSATSTRQVPALARALAVLNGLEYASPALVAMAARKVYAHRVRVGPVRMERSLRWGSDVAAVAKAMHGVTAEQVVEEVLRTVVPPL